jgi:hypothetical protein
VKSKYRDTEETLGENGKTTERTSDSPDRRDWTAWCSATMLLEQAVSIVAEGPLQSKKYDMRFDMIAVETPVAKYWGTLSEQTPSHQRERNLGRLGAEGHLPTSRSKRFK